MTSTDELEQKINLCTNNKEKIDLLNELTETIRNSDLQKSFNYSKIAVELAEKSFYPEGLAKSYRNYGINLRLNSKFNEAFDVFDKALKIYKDAEDLHGEAAVINSLANVYANTGNYQKAREFLNKSLRIVQKVNDKELEASIVSNFGSIHHEMGDYSSALEYYMKSALIHTQYLQGIPETLLNNIGEVYKMLCDYDTALEYYYKSLKLARDNNNRTDESFALFNIALVYCELKDIDRALVYLSESSQLLKVMGFQQSDPISSEMYSKGTQELNETDRELDFQYRVLTLREDIADIHGKAQTLSKIGNIYFSCGKYTLAEKYYCESLKLSIDLDDKLNQSLNYLYLGRFFVMKKEYPKAFENLEKSLELANKLNAKKDVSDVHKAFYEAYKSMGDFSNALIHHEKYRMIENEVFNHESDRKLHTLTLKYENESAEKEKTIALQENEIYKLKNVKLSKVNRTLEIINEEKSDIMGIAAHDLKNPLSGIMSFSKRIENSDDMPREQVREYAGDIRKASEKMFEMITKILDVSAIESGKRSIEPEKFEVSVLAERVILDYRKKADAKNIQLIFNCPDDLEVFLDKMALRQILDNLISNAIKFSPSGRKVFFNILPKDDSIYFSVIDEGPGLTEDDKLNLFGKFKRLSAQPTGDENSTGLGLSIAKKLTEAMNGKIWCESEAGKGAEFIVEFPANYNG